MKEEQHYFIFKKKLLKGFTLVEIMVAASISVAILGVIFYFIVAGENYLQIVNTRTTLQQDLRRVVGELQTNLSKACYYQITGNNRHLKIHIPKEYSEGKPSSYESIHYKIKKDNITRDNDLILDNVSLLTDFSEIKELKFGVLKIFLKAERECRRNRQIKAEMISFVHSRNIKLGHRCDNQKKYKD